MKVAVCIKHVPEGPARLDPVTRRIDRTREGTLNGVDANAVEEALRINEAAGAEVVVVSLGPPVAVESLRRALALGADRAVLVSDDAAAGSDLHATTEVLAKLLEREQADLVLFGQQSTDAGGAVLWASVAERLRLPVVSQATELSVEGQTAHVRRQTEFGYDTIDAPLPAVVAVSDAINDPRYPSLKGMMGAKKKPCDILSLGDLDLDPSAGGEVGSLTTVLSLGEPPARGGAVKIEDEGNAAQEIFDFLAAKELL